jgi:hypothetical protein
MKVAARATLQTTDPTRQAQQRAELARFDADGDGSLGSAELASLWLKAAASSGAAS